MRWGIQGRWIVGMAWLIVGTLAMAAAHAAAGGANEAKASDAQGRITFGIDRG